MKALITRKIGMTSIINDDGSMAAITLLSASPSVVTQLKSEETDGYAAVQLGFGNAKRINKPLAGHLNKSGSSSTTLREIRVSSTPNNVSVGDNIELEVFSIGDLVSVTATSKGKGWAGTIKRHNFHRQRKTHGGKGNTRKVGSIGSMYPQKIFKGKKMAGQMGADCVTVKNLKIAIIDKENSVIGVTGAVPGPRKGIVILKDVKS